MIRDKSAIQKRIAFLGVALDFEADCNALHALGQPVPDDFWKYSPEMRKAIIRMHAIGEEKWKQ